MPSPLTRLRDREFYSPPSEPPADRFIPTRALMDLDLARNSLYASRRQDTGATTTSPDASRYRRWVEENLRAGPDGKSFRMLPFRSPRGGDRCRRSLRLVDDMVEEAKESSSPAPAPRWRCIPMRPSLVFDVPGMTTDFYLNLLDWGKENILAMALGSSVYLRKEEGTSAQQLLQRTGGTACPTSVAWSCDGKRLAVGFADSQIEVWDIHAMHRIRTFGGHTDRVGSLCWNDNILTSGSRDKYIINYDVRSGKGVYHLKGHRSEVCGLRWSPDGLRLASGGNDNAIYVWHSLNIEPTKFLYRFTEHTAAVRALAWCPLKKNRLASGGGTADRCIKLWNTETGTCAKTTETGSQVCALVWDRHENEIISAHGYSNNQLSLWSYPSMEKVADLKWHTSRVLELSQSPDGLKVASASADETVCLWKISEPRSPSKKVTDDDDDSVLSLKRLQIR
ncbi:cell division cycle 20.3, cofactor of APC complex isoform X2 [Brachypodium distachyon]|uniref:cell division cycle 20.3, cofactor of APC complex isoform X2 n=1 Tax=Brachypodium distachyon TaxID=15368 RepID=UPI00071DF08F|nr:cell division cycle 20.3, cofactor of APC complex isoform X2 [Brachypodium distachyon]|eukprot:XP_014758801.1 cell division cycle 20.3, cofactor of APC complex isoform X2 [Brachypodium distachyon]